MTNRFFYAGLLLAFLLALAFRAPEMASRPMHNDEAVNAIKLRVLMERGEYRYDPDEYHGPTLIYSTLAFLKLTGANNFVKLSESLLRWVTALYGLGLVLLLAGLGEALGKKAAVVAAVLTAISPAMVFYSRYYIHEMLLVFFTFAALVCGWRYFRKPGLLNACLLGASIGLMQATKETFVFSFAAAFGAFVIQRYIPGESTSVNEPQSFRIRDILPALLAWLLVVVILFSSFFTNAAGIADAFKTYLPWLHRVQGASLHLHPWNFYLERLLWFHRGKAAIYSEGIIFLLSLAGTVSAFFGKPAREGNRSFIRFLASYTILLALIYCALSYKTTWCLLEFWHGLILLAGFGAVALWERLPSRALRTAFAALLLLDACQLGAQAWRASVTESSLPENPYNYAQTSEDILGLVKRVDLISRYSPDTTNMVLNISAPESEYWPLPWYLRAYPHCLWSANIPEAANAPVMIVSAQFHAHLDSTGTHVLVGTFQLRPNTFFELYVEKELFAAYVRSGAARELDE